MKIICIGRNYADHAKELNNDVPDEPVLFMKGKNAVLLPDTPLYYPEFTKNLQYECELVVRMARNGKHIQEKFAAKYYNEVSLGIDFTARDLQNKLKQKGLPWEISKAFDGSAAVGKFVPLTEKMDVQKLSFELHLNGKTVQSGQTSDMIFSINQLIAYASQYFTLNIGDLLFTGTPVGVGPVQLHDRLEAYLEGEKLLDIDIK